jgi:hypothetical protein
MKVRFGGRKAEAEALPLARVEELREQWDV